MADIFAVDLARIEHHCFMAKLFKIMLDLEIIENALFRQCFLELVPECRDIPFAVSQLVYKAPLGLIGSDLECVIEGFICGDDPEVFIEHYKGFANGFNDTLRILS